MFKKSDSRMNSEVAAMIEENKPEIAKMIINDKMNNSAVAQELKDGDIKNAIDNHATIMKQAYESYTGVPLIGQNYDYMLFIMCSEAFNIAIEPPYGSNNFADDGNE